MYGDPTPPDAETLARGPVEMPHYTRTWSFDPYHQRLVAAREHAPAVAVEGTEWSEWEVFQQERRGEHHKHVGTVHAPDADLALVLAKESFARRGECVNLWVARVEHIFATPYEDADVFVHTTNKDYREPGGYHGLRKSKIHGHDGEDRDTA
jgi:ring-1,2-phenylacetyl-CoA epoxidase subunit PaaB